MRREELVDELLRVGGNLDAIEAALAAMLRASGKGFDCPPDIVLLENLGKAAVVALTHEGGPHRGQPIGGRPFRLPTHMGELAHQRCAVVVNSGGELFEQRDNALVVDAELIARSLQFRGDRGPAAEHDKTDAAAGFLFGVALVAVRRQPAFSIATVVGGADHPVADCELPDGDRLQQRLEIYLWLGVRHTHPRLTRSTAMRYLELLFDTINDSRSAVNGVGRARHKASGEIAASCGPTSSCCRGHGLSLGDEGFESPESDIAQLVRIGRAP